MNKHPRVIAGSAVISLAAAASLFGAGSHTAAASGPPQTPPGLETAEAAIKQTVVFDNIGDTIINRFESIEEQLRDPGSDPAS